MYSHLFDLPTFIHTGWILRLLQNISSSYIVYQTHQKYVLQQMIAYMQIHTAAENLPTRLRKMLFSLSNTRKGVLSMPPPAPNTHYKQQEYFLMLCSSQAFKSMAVVLLQAANSSN